ncbi:unnamed protein product [Notodromas monacha]|uniref:Protein-serine/threonine kinase n=1 Tax=Notodromas monacha TaxID=399045 RepID=A0A7R9BPY1_9CRUS|nr:unnamed protein product [Notodromas monacha]CAG0919485.1 unnamed protein product [Notodromas monacha]
MRLNPVYFAKSIGRMLEYYSQFNPSPLSIKQFIDFGLNATERTSFNFLRLELPVRLANIMAEIQLLPEHLLAMPSFLDTLVKIRNRHSSVVETMAQGVIELKESKNVDAVTENAIQYFLDRFYMSRISIRMLINQHTLLFGGDLNSLHSNIGCIDTQCSIVNIIHDAFENARFLCEQYYLTSPELVVRGVDGKEPKDLQLVYVPSHLYHIFFELFKNALRAVVEHHGSGASEYPPIDVRISLGKEDLCIKMSDLGGGIPRSALDLLFAYTYSTAPQPSPSGSGSAPLAGYGYGLPLSRLYARYFRGDLLVTSMDGYGTDALVYLKALSSEANELLPIFNKATSKNYETSVQTSDWSVPGQFFSHVRHFSTAMPNAVPRRLIV